LEAVEQVLFLMANNGEMYQQLHQLNQKDHLGFKK